MTLFTDSDLYSKLRVAELQLLDCRKVSCFTGVPSFSCRPTYIRRLFAAVLLLLDL